MLGSVVVYNIPEAVRSNVQGPEPPGRSLRANEVLRNALNGNGQQSKSPIDASVQLLPFVSH